MFVVGAAVKYDVATAAKEEKEAKDKQLKIIEQAKLKNSKRERERE